MFKGQYQQKTCGQVLARNPDIVYASLIVTSLSQCADTCSMSNTCLGVNFSPPNGSTSNCELLSTNSSNQPFICESGWSFYEKF